jgi:cobalt/nickel transport protein
MKYWLEIIVIVVITAFAVIFLVQNAHMQGSLQPGQEAFTGTDDRATSIIVETGYHPWVSPLWVPPGSVESLIFSLQAAVGALIIGYFFGYYRGRKDGEQPKEPNGR